MTPVNILVVDDEEIMVILLETFLKRFACRISTAANGNEAIRLLENTAFDLVITDLQMEGTTGLDVVRKTKELSPKTLAFMMTGSNEVKNAIAAFRSGADDYLLKPFSMTDLQERLQKKGILLKQAIRTQSQYESYNRNTTCQKNLHSVKDISYT